MERLVANLIGNVRRESVDGRTYLVAPVAMIVPGVLNGSKGALMYPQDEVQKNPGVWNNVPITIGHPYGKNNEAVSARDPQTLEKFQIGAVYNDRFEGGKRVADGWFDEALTRKKAPEVYAALNAGTPMEVSTGLFTDDEPAQNGANHGGTPYQFVAKNYRPDHLAVLPNQRGACSIQDGCGLNTNANVIARDSLDKTTLNGFCPTGDGGGIDNTCGKEDGSGGKDRFDVGATAKTDREHKQAETYHIQQGKLAREAGNRKLAHLHYKAADAHHDATRDRDESFKRDARKASKDVEDHLKRNAAPNQPKSQNTGKYKAMNAGTGKGETHQAAQDGWHGGPKKTCDCPEGVACNCNLKSNSKRKRGRTMTRDESVQWLTTNCECHKGKDRVLANADNYSDDEIAALVENERRNQTNQLVVNKFVEAVPGVQNVTINEIPAFVKGKVKPGDEGMEEDPEAEAVAEEESEEEMPVGNAKKPMTAEEYLARMPESLRPVWNAMVATTNKKTADLMAEGELIVKNERDAVKRDAIREEIKERASDPIRLERYITSIRPTQNKSRVAPTPAPAHVPSYFGMQGGPAAAPTGNAELPVAELMLDIPTLNFAELASPTFQKTKR